MSDEKAKVHPPFVHSDTPREPPVTGEKAAPMLPSLFGGFDWKSAASLRAPEKPGEKAARAWDSTDWEDPAPAVVSDEARRVAEQIDAVAQKIRKGELTVAGKAPTAETAMAAGLEALIRAK